MSKLELVDIAAEIKVETPAAYLIYDGAKTGWVPKSQVEYDQKHGVFTMPIWLAKDKEFI